MVKIKLETQNLFVSTFTIRKIAEEANLGFKSKPKKPPLTIKHKERRLAFANQFLRAENVNLEKRLLFYDESYIWMLNRTRGAWLDKNCPNYKTMSVPSTRFSAKLMVAAFISWNGKRYHHL